MAMIVDRLGDPRDMTLDEVLDYCMAVTNKSPEQQCLDSTKAQYAGVYLTWKCLNEEFGARRGRRALLAVLETAAEDVIRQSGERAENGPTEDGAGYRPDSPRLLPRCPFQVRSCERHTERMDRRRSLVPDPKLGPADVHARRMAYYKTEYSLSIRVNEYVIELAGLQDEVEHEQPTAVCACADDKACRMIYRKRRSAASTRE